MLNFSVKYLGFLKDVPLLPHLLEAWLRVLNTFFNPGINKLIDQLEQEVETWEGISVGLHKYGGIQFNYGNIEVGHIHGNGLLDILFKKEIRDHLIREGKASPHHFFKDSGWISFYLKSENNLNNAIELLKMSKNFKARKHA